MRERDRRAQIGERARALLAAVEHERRAGGAGKTGGASSATRRSSSARRPATCTRGTVARALADELLAEAHALTLTTAPRALSAAPAPRGRAPRSRLAQQPQRGFMDARRIFGAIMRRSHVPVVVPMHRNRVCVVEQRAPAEDREVEDALRRPGERLEACTLQHQRTDARVGRDEVDGAAHELLLGLGK